MTGAVVRFWPANVQRLGLPEGATATRFPSCSVYMLVPAKAGSVSVAKAPVSFPDAFERMIGESKVG